MKKNHRSWLKVSDIQVFREEPGFIKLFTLFKEKYRSLGRIGGTVSIKGFSPMEMESIAGFLAEPTDTLLEKGKVSLLTFEKALQHTPFSNYSLIQLLEEVLQESLLTKEEANLIEQNKKTDFLESLCSACPNGSWWWEWIHSKSSDTRWIWALYKQDSSDLFLKLITVFKAFQVLPTDGKYERLPLFAQRTTGNPHFFDMDQVAGKLLLHCFHVDQIQKGYKLTVIPKTTEEINDLLSQYGIMRDDLWSFVTCRGFLAECETGIHPVWKAAVEMDTVLNIPIKELIKLKKIWPAKGNKVWIVENSGVCSTIIDEVAEAPIICTHGQFRTASWAILDQLIESRSILYYSSDIDPEGITMAERIKERYKEQVTIWRMDKNSYEKSLSNEDISSRLSKIETINSPELLETVRSMKTVKMAGYQEGLVNELIQDIKKDFL